MQEKQPCVNGEAYEAERRKEEKDEPQSHDIDGCPKDAVSDP
jgi:hypothetical protein